MSGPAPADGAPADGAPADGAPNDGAPADHAAAATLWADDDPAAWTRALDAYDAVIARQGVARLPALDRWYRETLPALLAERTPAHLTHDDLVRVTEWKMARGVWRARNLVLVRGNAPDLVEAVTAEALAPALDDERRAMAALTRLAGVGPATASAVLAAAAPARHPFLDELVAAQVPGLGPPAFTAGYQRRYAEALRARAARLGAGWTPARVERALWAHVGGKAGATA